MSLTTIVSGGQTGADRAALDCARELGLVVDAWVPAGRWAEDGAIAPCYRGLKETPTDDPAERTELNVRDSDATVIFSHGALSGGSALTERLAIAYRRPCLHIDFDTMSTIEASAHLRAFIARHRIARLNVAGPRRSEDDRIYEATHSTLLLLITTARMDDVP